MAKLRQSVGRWPWLWLLWVGLSPIAQAAAEERSSAPDLFDASYLFQVVGSLLLVFGCIFGLIFLLKKLNGLPAGDRAPIRVLGSARVGAREKVLLVEVGEQQLLLGVTTASIRTLHTFDKPIIDSAAASKTGEFSALLGASFSSGKTS